MNPGKHPWSQQIWQDLYWKVHDRATSVFVCPVINHEFRQNIVTVAVDPRGDGRVALLTTFFESYDEMFIVNNRTDALKTDNNLFQKLSNSALSLVDASHKL